MIAPNAQCECPYIREQGEQVSERQTFPDKATEYHSRERIFQVHRTNIDTHTHTHTHTPQNKEKATEQKLRFPSTQYSI